MAHCLYRAAELVVKRYKGRKGVMVLREPVILLTRRYKVWSVDFVMGFSVNGRGLKVLTVQGYCTKEAGDLVAYFGVPGHHITKILDQVALFRWYPKAVRTDQRPEYTCRA